MDNLTKSQRRKNMQNIRAKNTKPEILIFKELRRKKIYFAKHVDKLIGKPDIVFRRKKVAVFVDSDFWHGNPKRFILPKTNIGYWKSKIERNKKRDKSVNRVLKNMGWKVVRIWEYEIKKNTNKVIRRILDSIDMEI